VCARRCRTRRRSSWRSAWKSNSRFRPEPGPLGRFLESRMARRPSLFEASWKATKCAVKTYLGHDPSTLGSALAYYTVFSIAPVLLVVTAVAGLALGPEAVQGEIKGQMEGLIGPEGAAQIETMVKGAFRPG